MKLYPTCLYNSSKNLNLKWKHQINYPLQLIRAAHQNHRNRLQFSSISQLTQAEICVHTYLFFNYLTITVKFLTNFYLLFLVSVNLLLLPTCCFSQNPPTYSQSPYHLFICLFSFFMRSPYGFNRQLHLSLKLPLSFSHILILRRRRLMKIPAVVQGSCSWAFFSTSLHQRQFFARAFSFTLQPCETPNGID